MTGVRLATVDLPDFGVPVERPELPAALYAERVERLRARAAEAGFDRLVVYADREHSANLSFLTGFDPRFEEAMLVLGPTGTPAILVGNECWGMAGAAPLPMERHRYQDFSLPSQPRDRSLPLAEILGAEGIGRGSRVGVVGWKAYDRPRRGSSCRRTSSTSCASSSGRPGSVANANALLTDPADGLRIINDVDQLAMFEWASCVTSSGVRRLLHGLAPGPARIRGRRAPRLERDAAVVPRDADRRAAGHATGCSARATGRSSAATGSRPRSGSGAPSPAGRASSSRTPRELPDGIGDYVDRLVGPYFAAVAEWYGALHIGQTGGTLQAIIDRHLGDPFFGIFLNPGHQLHLDEWVNSPVWPGSTVELRSGMAMQVDIIPATGTPYFTTNIEDGIALADETLRAAFAAALPARPGRASRRAGGSWPTPSASTSIRTCCRSRTWRPPSRRSCCGPSWS